ncbi:MAG: hypothetical protein V2B19_26225 [Pseudomonadota bacterium]
MTIKTPSDMMRVDKLNRCSIIDLRPVIQVKTQGLDHRTDHARIFFPDRQELAIAQTACRSSKNTLAQPPCRGKLAATMIKAKLSNCIIALKNQAVNNSSRKHLLDVMLYEVA